MSNPPTPEGGAPRIFYVCDSCGGYGHDEASVPHDDDCPTISEPIPYIPRDVAERLVTALERIKAVRSDIPSTQAFEIANDAIEDYRKHLGPDQGEYGDG